MPDPLPARSVPGVLAALLSRLRQQRSALALGASIAIFSLALIACRHLLAELDLTTLREALHDVPGRALLGATLATLVGFIALLGYEWSASRYAGASLPTRVLGLGGFCAFAISNALGLSLLTGGGVRLRLYSRAGLNTSQIARMSLFSSLALGCSLPLLGALSALLDLEQAARALQFNPLLLGILSGLIVLVYALVARRLWWRRTALGDNPQNVLVRIRRRSLRLPSWRLSVLQLLISAIDVAAAAAVLYLLLPEAPPLGSFLLIYLLALTAGILSHIPGGIGVFEAVLLAAFSSTIGMAPLAAALLLYRLIYVVAPLLLACLLLLLNETQRLIAGAPMRVASGLAAPVLALLVFLSGMVLLFSGVTPAIDLRLLHLSFLVPHQLIETSHLAASLVGTLCMLLARGLARRLSAAWALTLVLLLAGAALCLLKGFDWEEASLLMITAALLARFRQSFYRHSRLLEIPSSPLFLLTVIGVLAASLWLLLFTYQDVPYSHELWWQFELDDNAPRGLRALLASSLLILSISLTWLLRSHPPVINLPSSEELQRAHQLVLGSSQPEGSLAMSGDKTLLFNAEGDAFLMYARRGRSLVALFDPVGNTCQRAELIWQFRDLCDMHHTRPVFYQVRAENLPYYMDIGLSAIKLGEEALVDLHKFELESIGKNMKDLRYTWNRGQRDGLQLEIFEPGCAPLDELELISSAWLQGKSVREKGFSLGRFTPGYLNYFRIALIRFQGKPVAFANLLETQRNETASLDLMRMHPQAPNLTMEFLLLGLILHFKALGAARFSLGMVPLAGLAPRRGAPLPQRLGALIFERGEHFYNFRGLRRFKEKFQPQWEPRYMAVPAGFDPLLALADTAALIAGGLSGLVKR